MISSVKTDQSNETIVEIRQDRRINLFKHLLQDESVDTTIFFIHGSMATYRQFDDMLSYLKDKFPVNLIAYVRKTSLIINSLEIIRLQQSKTQDAYGCGKSERPRDWVTE